MKAAHVLTRWGLHLLLLACVPSGAARELAEPKKLAVKELREFAKLTPPQQKRITTALAVQADHGWLRYQFGSADPANEGFDCSGAMNYVLASLNYQIPRTSSQQFLWLQKNNRLTKVGAEVKSLADPVFKKLQPGDLVFWSGTYTPTDGRKTKVTHVGMYLGTEKEDGRHVMICASKGRSYRGTAADGYGVFDFRLPRPSSKAKLVGFGSPPEPEETEKEEKEEGRLPEVS